MYSHPQGLGQTQKWLSENIPNAERITVSSTSEAARTAALEISSAAICSELCSKFYDLNIVEANIEDKAGKQFFILKGFRSTFVTINVGFFND